MKFVELPEESKDCARAALCALLTTGGHSMVAERAKVAGEFVSAAFIAMESHDGAPDVCGDKSHDGFDEAAQPLIKWLAENVHPHHTAVVTSTSAELLELERSFSTTEYLRD